MLTALKVAFALASSTVCAVAAFFLSFAITGQMWFNLAAATLAFSTCMWFVMQHSKYRRAIAVIGGAGLLVAVSLPTLLDRVQAKPAPVSEEVIRQLRQAVIPLRGVNAGEGFEDLEPLQKVWQGTRIVALGEATHGTSEFFRMKHRLTEFLVTQMGFHHFAMEVDDREAQRIETYIQEGGSNPVARLSWPWGTHEMADLVEWMRKHNAAAHPVDRVHFHGIDFQGDRRDLRMAQNTLSLLEGLGPEARIILWAHNAHVSSGPGWMGSYLKSALRSQIYLTGFEFDRGRFTSKLEWVHTYEAEQAGQGYYAEALARLGKPVLFLDFRNMQEYPGLDAWLQQPHFAHELQEGHGVLRLNPAWVRTNESWPSLFDGVVYIQDSTPAKLL